MRTMRSFLYLAVFMTFLLAGCRADPSPVATVQPSAPAAVESVVNEPTTAVDIRVPEGTPSDTTLEPKAPQYIEEVAATTTPLALATPEATTPAAPEATGRERSTGTDTREVPTSEPAATPEPTPFPAVTPSVQERDKAPAVVAGDVKKVVAGNTAFALDLYAVLSEEDGNLFYSPYSISLALALAYGGARGATETQMAETLRFDFPQDRLHTAFNALDLELAPPSQEKEGGGFELSIANSVWGQEGHGFLQDYLDTLSLNYGGKLRDVDFRGQPQDARIRINDWVSEETGGRIEDLIAPDAIDRFTRLVLANAVYFKAEWHSPFDERATSRAPFYALDGGENRVEMMRQTESFGYARGGGYQAVELPYKGGEMSMVILLPDSGRFAEFESVLESAWLNGVVEDLESRRVRLAMPTFELEASLDLADTLEAMGMPNAFDENKAEFQGMDGLSCLAGDDECLLISDVVHRAFVSVDEVGTEAAAATAVIVGITKSVPEEPIELTIDRPFIFLIRDRETGTVLFLGRVVKL